MVAVAEGDACGGGLAAGRALDSYRREAVAVSLTVVLDQHALASADQTIEPRTTPRRRRFAPVTLAGGVRGQTGIARVMGRNGDKLAADWA